MLDECLDVVEFFDLAQVASVPWKNGGGSTRELACWPPGAGMDGFEWRVSVATIATPGPFSAFAGVDRQIMLLDGDGVHLQSALGLHGGWAHTLDKRWRPFAFAGEAPVDCSMLGRTSTDFNLMVRRGVWAGTMQVVQSAQSVTAQQSAGLCLVLAGTWQWGSGDAARTLAAGQGAWWVRERDVACGADTRHPNPDGDAHSLALVTPFAQGEGKCPPTLAWIALHRVSEFDF